MAGKSSTGETVKGDPFIAAMKAEAKEVGLRYCMDDGPGIGRKLKRNAFVYFDTSGRPVKDEASLARIKRLAIPPAWTEVWISPYENGHIQATGRDARGRKQYRYHADWRQQRDANKFVHMVSFAHALPQIRRRVRRDLARRGMPREKVLATVVRLLETTLIRVGNDEYARTNGSYGLTTMHNKHAKIRGAKVAFAFRGKSGKRHEISVADPQLARVVRRCQEMPGQELFAYEDEEKRVRDVGSADVNDYLRQISGEDFTAKDFRTWAGTVLAAVALKEFQGVARKAEAKKNIVAAIEAVSKMLGNTPAVCRKCYVHPEVLDSYLEGDTIATIRQRVSARIDASLNQLKPEEAAVLVLLQRRLKSPKSMSLPIRRRRERA